MNSKRNTVTKIIAPGIWEDANGSIHWNVPDLLANAGLEYTEENRAIVIGMLTDLIFEKSPEAKIIKRTRPDE